MKFSKLTLAIATTLSVSTSFSAFAMELYVDTKTKQIYAEPGRGRELMGSFQKVDDAPAKVAEKSDKTEIKEIREELASKDNEIKALQEHVAEATGPESVKTHFKDGLHFETRDGNYKAEIHGFGQVDSQANFSRGPASPETGQDSGLSNGMTIRRARLSLDGTIHKDFGYKFEYDFVRGNGTTLAGFTDMFLTYKYSKPTTLTVGQFKEPVGLDEYGSNKDTTFIERQMLSNAFVDNLQVYKLGIGGLYAEDRWAVNTTLQTEGVGAFGPLSPSTGGGNRSGKGNTNWEVNGRVTGLPWMESKTKFLHTGVSGSYIDLNKNNVTGNPATYGAISWASQPNSSVDRTGVVNTGNVLNLNSLTRFGAETALVYGPLSVQGEYMQTNTSGGNNGNETLEGYYGFMSYALTGESRPYKAKNGTIGKLKPTRNFDLKSGGGWGAWEVAAGFDGINLNSGPIRGGKMSLVKFGLNWYLNPNVMFKANYVHALDVNTAGANNSTAAGFNGKNIDFLDTRIQFTF